MGLIERAEFTPEQSAKAIKWVSANRTALLDELTTIEAAKLIQFVEGKLA